MGSFEASYKDFNLHILSVELDGVRCIHYLTVVCTYKRDQQRGGGDIELNALRNKSWACAQALSHKCRCGAWEGRKRSNATMYEKRDVANTSAKQGKSAI